MIEVIEFTDTLREFPSDHDYAELQRWLMA
jgi:hypothetical protein